MGAVSQPDLQHTVQQISYSMVSMEPVAPMTYDIGMIPSSFSPLIRLQDEQHRPSAVW